MTELALIAFDGLDPRVIYDNLDRLNNFADFIDESMHGKWKTPGHTIPSFTSTLTGKQFNMVNFHWDEGKGNYQRHSQVPQDMLWEVSDSSMTLLNIPTLYPPEGIDDCMVCGFLTPDSQVERNLARPVSVQKMLNDIGYIHDVNADRTYEEMGGDMIHYLTEMMNRRVKASEMLINEFDSDLFYGVWTAPDRWFHQCHLHDESHMVMYRLVNKILGNILELIPDDIPTIVFSDHGFAHYPQDEGVHKGHMYDGFYSIRADSISPHRNDSVNILDLFPTVVNYLDGEIPDMVRGRVLFNPVDQDNEVKSRLEDLGYLE